MKRFAQFKKDYVLDREYPGDAVCLVEKGDIVKEDTTVFEGQRDEIIQSINLAKELGVSISKVAEYLEVDHGEIVSEGDVLAGRLVSLGIVERVVKTSVDGRISFDRLGAGIIDILGPRRNYEMKAGLKGEVSQVYPSAAANKQISFETAGYVSSVFWAGGKSLGGELALIKDGDSLYTPGDVGSGCEDKIVVAGRKLTIRLYESLAEAGALGVICGGMDLLELGEINDFAVPVVLTEGWGTIPVNFKLLGLFQQSAGSIVYINTADPHIFVYSDAPRKEFEDANIDQIMKPELIKELKVGDVAQIFELPYFGYSGKVVKILEEENLAQIELESKRRVLVSPESLVVI